MRKNRYVVLARDFDKAYKKHVNKVKGVWVCVYMGIYRGVCMYMYVCVCGEFGTRPTRSTRQ